MDLDFGISLDPSSVAQRHTLYDSDDEEETAVAQSPNFSVKSTQDSSINVNVLVFVFGQVASVFVRSYFNLEAQPRCRITSDSSTVFKDKYFVEERKDSSLQDGEECTTSEIYKMEAECDRGMFLVCIHDKPLKLEHVNPWTAKIFDNFTVSNVLVLCSLPLCEHLSLHHSEDQQMFLRALQTSNWPHTTVATFLEPANSLSGEPASVLTHCQVKGVAGSAAALYFASSVVLTEAVAAFQPLLTLPLLSDNLKINSEVDALRLAKGYLPKAELCTLYT